MSESLPPANSLRDLNEGSLSSRSSSSEWFQSGLHPRPRDWTEVSTRRLHSGDCRCAQCADRRPRLQENPVGSPVLRDERPFREILDGWGTILVLPNPRGLRRTWGARSQSLHVNLHPGSGAPVTLIRRQRAIGSTPTRNLSHHRKRLI